MPTSNIAANRSENNKNLWACRHSAVHVASALEFECRFLAKRREMFLDITHPHSTRKAKNDVMTRLWIVWRVGKIFGRYVKKQHQYYENSKQFDYCELYLTLASIKTLNPEYHWYNTSSVHASKRDAYSILGAYCFSSLKDGRLFEVGANSRLSA